MNGVTGSGGNWSVAHYTEGAWMKDELRERVRRIAEGSDHFIGFWVFNSLAGGSGSGVGTTLNVVLREEYSHKSLLYWSVVPRATSSDSVLEVYNAVLSWHYLVEHVDSVTYFDNPALSSHLTSSAASSFKPLNARLLDACLDVSASWRLGGQLNASIKKSLTNLIAFPRMHFFACSTCVRPSDLWKNKNVLSSIDLEGSSKSIFTQFLVARGLDISHLEEVSLSHFQKHQSLF